MGDGAGQGPLAEGKVYFYRITVIFIQVKVQEVRDEEDVKMG
jgi:hypothetical protein